MARLGSELLALPVRLGDIVLGHAVDVLADARLTHAVGLEVRCGDDEHRFLPLASATLGDEDIAVSTPFALLERDELDFYSREGASLRALRGVLVSDEGRTAGELADLELLPDGRVEGVLVRTGDLVRRVRPPALGL